MNLSEQDKRDIARYMLEMQGAPRSQVPTDFIRFKELRELPAVEISDAFKIPMESEKETVISRLDTLANYIAPRATDDIYGISRISDSLESMSQDTAASSAAVRELKNLIDTCAKLAGAVFTGDIQAPNVIATAGMRAKQVTAEVVLSLGNMEAQGDFGVGKAIYCKNDITAFSTNTLNTELMPNARKVIDHKAESFNKYTVIDIIELLADHIDKKVK